MSARKISDQTVKFIVGAGKATPGPPIGPALGSKGIKAIDFCKEFNARTTQFIVGTPMPCRVTVRPDRTFVFDIRTPQTSWLILNAAKIQPGSKGRKRGASKPGHESVGSVSLKHVYEIAKIKASEERMGAVPMQGLCRSIIFQCRGMGIDVVP